jgi:hypothetical protein
MIGAGGSGARPRKRRCQGESVREASAHFHRRLLRRGLVRRPRRSRAGVGGGSAGAVPFGAIGGEAEWHAGETDDEEFKRLRWICWAWPILDLSRAARRRRRRRNDVPCQKVDDGTGSHFLSSRDRAWLILSST